MNNDKFCLLKRCDKYPPTHTCVLFVVESFRSIGIVESDAFVERSDVEPSLTLTFTHSLIQTLPSCHTHHPAHTYTPLPTIFLFVVVCGDVYSRRRPSLESNSAIVPIEGGSRGCRL